MGTMGEDLCFYDDACEWSLLCGTVVAFVLAVIVAVFFSLLSVRLFFVVVVVVG